MNTHTLHVRERFDGEAENWNAQYHPSTSGSIYAHNLLRRQQQTQTLIDNTGGRLLDIGCGAGNVLLSVASTTQFKPFGADFSTNMLFQARQNARHHHRSVPLLATDVCHLPFVSNSFDAILCLGVLEYIPHYTQVLSECARLLKPGGQFIVSVPNGTSPFIRFDDLMFAIKNIITRGFLPPSLRKWIKTRIFNREDKPYFNHQKQRFSPLVFGHQLKQAGFDIRNQCYHTYGFGILEGSIWNVRISKYIENRTTHHPNMEKLGWTYILKAVKQ